MEFVILALVAVGVFFALRHVKRNGVSCGGNCAGCSADCKHRK